MTILKYLSIAVIGWALIDFTVWYVKDYEHLEAWDYCEMNGWCDEQSYFYMHNVFSNDQHNADA